MTNITKIQSIEHCIIIRRDRTWSCAKTRQNALSDKRKPKRAAKKSSQFSGAVDWRNAARKRCASDETPIVVDAQEEISSREPRRAFNACNARSFASEI
jgi:uncharacterized protein with PIN domain